ncbi:MAG: 30S ribosomal protein S13 [Verrucomicrobia bacterium]|jgi:small subunit ribosomal protein S13|nr:30S ribosomal protein S13 [Verrucomicrobiota bacterium]
MPRIAGVDIPKKKRLEVALTYIYGMGEKRAKDVIAALKLNPDMHAEKLTEAETAQLTSHIQSHYAVEGDLRRETQANIKRLVAINSYRGMRHKLGLPTRGQRTRTNARTRKGKKKTVANKKKVTK